MKRLILALLAIIAAVFTTHGQTSEQVVPVDTALRQGVLPNGMTYYVRKATSKRHIGEFHVVSRHLHLQFAGLDTDLRQLVAIDDLATHEDGLNGGNDGPNGYA